MAETFEQNSWELEVAPSAYTDRVEDVGDIWRKYGKYHLTKSNPN